MEIKIYYQFIHFQPLNRSCFYSQFFKCKHECTFVFSQNKIYSKFTWFEIHTWYDIILPYTHQMLSRNRLRKTVLFHIYISYTNAIKLCVPLHCVVYYEHGCGVHVVDMCGVMSCVGLCVYMRWITHNVCVLWCVDL